MASFLNANLDSEDEEDDDYNPTAAEDRQVEREEGIAPKGKAKRPSKRGRVPSTTPADAETVADADAEEEDDEGNEEALEQPKVLLPKPGNAAAKRAKIEAVWQALNSRDTGGSNACGAPSSSTSLAALCRRTQVTSAPTPELTWQRQLQLVSPKQQLDLLSKKAASNHAQVNGGNAGLKAGEAGAEPKAAVADEVVGSASLGQAEAGASGGRRQISQDAKAAAAAALTAAKEAASVGVSRSYNKVSVTETRRFAGQDIQVTVQVDKDSKEAAKKDSQKAGAPSGLDRFLAELEKKKKVNILDKSKMDWNQLKSNDTQMEFELEAHKRSNNKYLDKVDFLKKAELREYELERDKRLAGDIRLRNRL